MQFCKMCSLYWRYGNRGPDGQRLCVECERPTRNVCPRCRKPLERPLRMHSECRKRVWASWIAHAKNGPRHRARAQIYMKVRRGQLVRPSCPDCDRPCAFHLRKEDDPSSKIRWFCKEHTSAKIAV